MSDHVYHRSLHLENFTVFGTTAFEFSPGINAFIGTNGTGKTHLLKLLYAVQYHGSRERSHFPTVLRSVFLSENFEELVRKADDSTGRLRVSGTWGGETWRFGASDASDRTGKLRPVSRPPEFDEAWKNAANLPLDNPQRIFPRPVLIPSIDMIGHTRRFLSTYDEYRIDFDQTHRDIVALLLAPERRGEVQGNGLPALLEATLGGEVEEENERFYLATPNGRFAMPLVAEGLRKIATLHQLLKNGYLKPGDTLYWDEPEVNLNPTLMDEVISVLLTLARSGVQIFLTTHSYVILKELDLQSEVSDQLRYFALANSGVGTVVTAANRYSELHPNAISDQFDSLYDRELDRSIGRKRRS